jgi:hypothetical protein
MTTKQNDTVALTDEENDAVALTDEQLDAVAGGSAYVKRDNGVQQRRSNRTRHTGVDEESVPGAVTIPGTKP